MLKKCFFLLTTTALALASAATQYITLYQPSELNGQTLKPGEYRVELNGDRMTLSQGKKRVEASVVEEDAGLKARSNTVRLRKDGDHMLVDAIQLNGQTKRLRVVGESAGERAGQ